MVAVTISRLFLFLLILMLQVSAKHKAKAGAKAKAKAKVKALPCAESHLVAPMAPTCSSSQTVGFQFLEAEGLVALVAFLPLHAQGSNLGMLSPTVSPWYSWNSPSGYSVTHLSDLSPHHLLFFLLSASHCQLSLWCLPLFHFYPILSQ